MPFSLRSLNFFSVYFSQKANDVDFFGFNPSRNERKKWRRRRLFSAIFTGYSRTHSFPSRELKRTKKKEEQRRRHLFFFVCNNSLPFLFGHSFDRCPRRSAFVFFVVVVWVSDSSSTGRRLGWPMSSSFLWLDLVLFFKDMMILIARRSFWAVLFFLAFRARETAEKNEEILFWKCFFFFCLSRFSRSFASLNHNALQKKWEKNQTETV